MASQKAEQFMNTLQEIEQSGEVEPLVALFGDDAKLRRVGRPETYSGREGARKFWQQYLHAFEQIRSSFFNVIESEDAATLEWTSEGMLSDGNPFSYEGVSILEFQGEHVAEFRTYYDSAAFVSTPAE